MFVKCDVKIVIWKMCYVNIIYIYIYIYIYTELAPKLSATASVAQW